MTQIEKRHEVIDILQVEIFMLGVIIVQTCDIIEYGVCVVTISNTPLKEYDSYLADICTLSKPDLSLKFKIEVGSLVH